MWVDAQLHQVEQPYLKPKLCCESRKDSLKQASHALFPQLFNVFAKTVLPSGTYPSTCQFNCYNLLTPNRKLAVDLALQQRSSTVPPPSLLPVCLFFVFCLFLIIFSYCELLEAKGIMCSHSFTSLLLPYLQKELQVSTHNTCVLCNSYEFVFTSFSECCLCIFSCVFTCICSPVAANPNIASTNLAIPSSLLARHPSHPCPPSCSLPSPTTTGYPTSQLITQPKTPIVQASHVVTVL